ncbi:hypothetical protein BDR03DRAFT_984973 [Suillus americanus]|nr:hypothetical protein BDR03DRAFT_984973 [Suillus americanus]
MSLVGMMLPKTHVDFKSKVASKERTAIHPKIEKHFFAPSSLWIVAPSTPFGGVANIFVRWSHDAFTIYLQCPKIGVTSVNKLEANTSIVWKAPGSVKTSKRLDIRFSASHLEHIQYIMRCVTCSNARQKLPQQPSSAVTSSKNALQKPVDLPLLMMAG